MISDLWQCSKAIALSCDVIHLPLLQLPHKEKELSLVEVLMMGGSAFGVVRRGESLGKLPTVLQVLDDVSLGHCAGADWFLEEHAELRKGLVKSVGQVVRCHAKQFAEDHRKVCHEDTVVLPFLTDAREEVPSNGVFVETLPHVWKQALQELPITAGSEDPDKGRMCPFQIVVSEGLRY